MKRDRWTRDDKWRKILTSRTLVAEMMRRPTGWSYLAIQHVVFSPFLFLSREEVKFRICAPIRDYAGAWNRENRGTRGRAIRVNYVSFILSPPSYEIVRSREEIAGRISKAGLVCAAYFPSKSHANNSLNGIAFQREPRYFYVGHPGHVVRVFSPRCRVFDQLEVDIFLTNLRQTPRTNTFPTT